MPTASSGRFARHRQSRARPRAWTGNRPRFCCPDASARCSSSSRPVSATVRSPSSWSSARTLSIGTWRTSVTSSAVDLGRRPSPKLRASACSEPVWPGGAISRRWTFRAMWAAWSGPTVASMTTETMELDPVVASPTWTRVFAAIYDPSLWIGERAGMRGHRHDLLAQARGRTLEIGSGTGLKLRHYPRDVDDLVLAEPDPSMRKRLEAVVHRSEHNARLIDANAEQLPLADASIDTVVSTLVLCTVDAPDLALREIARVLRPDGQLLFIEHVRSESPGLARWQDRLVRPWQRFAAGCRCNRATLELMDASGFHLQTRPAAWRAMPPIIRPLAIGRATVAASLDSIKS